MVSYEIKKLPHLRSCHFVSQNRRYLAGFGAGITVYSRDSLEYVCHFSGISYICAGGFLGEDTIFVATTEHRFYLLSIQKQDVLWRVGRQRNWAKYGDPVICVNQEEEIVYAVIRGAQSLNHHYLVSFYCRDMKIVSTEIPDCLRVIRRPAMLTDDGCCFLHYESPGDGTFISRLTQYDTETQLFRTKWEEASMVHPIHADAGGLYYFTYDSNGEYIIHRDLGGDWKATYLLPVQKPVLNPWTWEQLAPPPPKICDTGGGLLASTADSLYRWNGNAAEPAVGLQKEGIRSGAIIDDLLFACCSDGLYYMRLK